MFLMIRELGKNVHRLCRFGLRLDDSPKRGCTVHYNLDSTLVVEVKSTQHLNHLLMVLKESVLIKFNEPFS